MLASHYQINRPFVIRESFDDEDVIVNLDTGSYFSLNKTGTKIFNLLEAGATIDSASDHMIQTHTGDVAVIDLAVCNLIEQLLTEGLILAVERTESMDNHDAAPIPDDAEEKPAFTPPILEKYTDMQEMLLLDPVHDVDDSGWPARKPDSV
ncbi:MAG: hypothetical protein DHS20C01_33080 [marine bacterium B5-7]|nr:MAG: hypothetical protein DHS20C01_33080 [marine bacterium B5-7]